jgi:hypothetical protein
MKKDALICSAKLIQQAKECGYFLTEEQCVAQLIASSDNTQDPVSQSSLNNNKASTLDSSNHSSTSSINCCWSKILLQQSDFLTKKPSLQTIIKDSVHICLFLPKFHCKLNPIELFWLYIKECTL